MTFQDSWMTPEGGDEMPPGPTIKDLNHIPVPYGRDVQTDSRILREMDSPTGGNIMDDRDLDDVGYMVDMDVTSLGTEKRRGGWDPLATPNGGPPAKASTAGTRGARDIGAISDNDGSLP